MLGSPRLHLRSTDSTNARARDLAAAGAPHGLLVTAGEQSAGRGRQGRTWSAPPGRALLMSLVLRDWPALLPLAAGVAVAEVCGGVARVKWPNDVLIDERKVAGILVEGRPQEGWMVLGIGVNVAVRQDDLPAELRHTAATLELAPAAVEEVLASLLAALGRRLAEDDSKTLAAFTGIDALLGREISWATGTGRAAGVDASGHLLVDTTGGRVTLDAGEVHLRPAQSSTE